jgi:hypothetical protein
MKNTQGVLLQIPKPIYNRMATLLKSENSNITRFLTELAIRELESTYDGSEKKEQIEALMKLNGI